MGKKPLSIIDVQEDFVPGGALPVADGGQGRAARNELVRAAGGEVTSAPLGLRA
jgi:nicotinamidase-related amidase